MDAVETMMFTGETPWHGKGYHFQDPPATIEEAIKHSGLDWSVSLRPVYTERMKKDGVPYDPTAKHDLVQVPDEFAVVRDTDQSILGCVGARYRPLQNAAAFSAFQPFLDAGEATLETAGSLHGGRTVWILAKIKRPNLVIVPGDEIAKYILLSHSHDGLWAISFGLTPVRVVCANTNAMALKNQKSRFIKVKHTERAEQSLEEVARAINAADAMFEGTAEVYQKLARIAMNKKKLDKFFRLVCNVDPKVKADDIPTRTKNKMERLEELFAQGRGNDLPGVRGTLWAAYNAATEYINHEGGRNQDTRLTRLWMVNDQGPKVLQAAMALAA